MSETKFTPGPWVISNSGSAYMEGTIILTSDGYREIAGVWQDEDAHLIAAAPELYEALNDLLNDCINFDGGKLTDIFMVKASRALAKARGEV